MASAERAHPHQRGLGSNPRCYTWAEFVVGFRPCCEGFLLGSLWVFLLNVPQKQTFQNVNFTWEQWVKCHLARDMPQQISTSFSYYFIF